MHLISFPVAIYLGERSQQGDSALGKSEKEKQIIMDHLQELVVYQDKAMNILWANKSACDSVGRPESEVIGHKCYELWACRNNPCPDCAVLLAMASGQPREVEKTTADGRSWYVRGYPVRDESGAVTGGIELVADITENRNAHSDRRKLSRQLQQAQRMESIGTLAGGIAHDFNNILQTISGYAQLLMLEKPEAHKDINMLNEIEKAAQRASSLTQQLLTFSRRVESILSPVNLNYEIRQVKELLSRTLPKMIQIELDLTDGLNTIDADAAQIEQVLMNLAINAGHAMPDGGKLKFKTENIALNRELCDTHLGIMPGDYIRLSIIDNGSGIDLKTRERIFDPFFTTKEVGKGTGLGLSIVYGIVKNHRGHIDVDSAPGQGTTIQIYFPVGIEPIESCEHQTDADLAGRNGGETVLIVDDEETILNLGQRILKRFGYQTVLASSGEGALETYQILKDKIDLIILDLNMPGMGGQKCLEQLIQLNPQIKVIVASGYPPDGELNEKLNSVSGGYIAKPYRLDSMIKKVRQMLNDVPAA